MLLFVVCACVTVIDDYPGPVGNKAIFLLIADCGSWSNAYAATAMPFKAGNRTARPS
jgi:hypothetical protein